LSFLAALDLLAAGGAFRIFKELKFAAALISALYHQTGAALLASLVGKRQLTAYRTGDCERAPAARTGGLPLFYLPQTRWAAVTERASAGAISAELAVSFYKSAAMDAGLLVRRHIMPLAVRNIIRKNVENATPPVARYSGSAAALGVIKRSFTR